MNKKSRKNYNILKYLVEKCKNIQNSRNQTGDIKVDDRLLDYYISFVQNYPDNILIFSLDGEIVSHNRKIINEYLGYRPKEKFLLKNLSLKKAMIY